jgi:hypothetical protein
MKFFQHEIVVGAAYQFHARIINILTRKNPVAAPPGLVDRSVPNQPGFEKSKWHALGSILVETYSAVGPA